MAAQDDILSSMNLLRDTGSQLTSAVTEALSDQSFSLSGWEKLLSVTTQYAAKVDELMDMVDVAYDDDEIDDDQEESASDFTSTSHDLAMALTQKIFDQIKSMGGNANLLLSNYQKLFYKD